MTLPGYWMLKHSQIARTNDKREESTEAFDEGSRKQKSVAFRLAYETEGGCRSIKIMLMCAQLPVGWSSRLISSCVDCNDVAVILMLQIASFYGVSL